MFTETELADLQILDNTVPFGIVQFESSERPQISYVSDQMKKILKAPEDSEEALKIAESSIFMLFFPEDRRRFSLYLDRVEKSGNTFAADLDLLAFDGSRIHCFCWISKSEDGLRLICIDVSDWNKNKREQENKRYIKALSAVYDDIFEFDYSARTVKCIYSRWSPMLRWVRNVAMDISEATDRWILRKVPSEEREKLRNFFSADNSNRTSESESIDYHVLSSDSTTWEYTGVLIQTAPSIYLFCCRKAYEKMLQDTAQKRWSGVGPSIYIRTFGYFDVFVDDKPIAFRNEKSKELFALLVDRQGGYVSSDEAISFLWEDSPADSITLARYRKVALRLKNTLEEYGISDAVESVNGKRRIVTDRIRCDLYDYLSGKEEYRQLFKGSYLSNYSWAENTLAELQNQNAMA